MEKDKAKGEGVDEAEDADADEPAAIRQWKKMATKDDKAEAATVDSKATAEATPAEDAQAEVSCIFGPCSGQQAQWYFGIILACHMFGSAQARQLLLEIVQNELSAHHAPYQEALFCFP